MRKYIMFTLSKEIPERIFQQKTGYFGLLTSNKIENEETAATAIRLSILCLPIGEQQISSMFLYLTTKVKGLWKLQNNSFLYAPFDPGMAEVALSLGLTDKKLENTNYESVQYKVFKRISETLFPEEPLKMIVLRRVAERWCHDKKWKICSRCWLNKVCPKEY